MHNLYFQSPVGTLEIQYSERGVSSLQFMADAPAQVLDGLDFLGFKIMSELEKYFENGLYKPELPIDLSAGTDFQQKVWQALLQIPAGETKTYGELAEEMGQPGAAQAVGNANGQNPVLLLVPCHRIIGSNQQMVGYRGELWRKQWLLEHEGALQKSIQMNLF